MGRRNHIINIAITGSSGFVGTNFKNYYRNLEIKDVDLLVEKVEELDLSRISSIIHLTALVHQM